MRVKATPGLQCPKEQNPREYIGDDDAGVEVEASAYYRRLLDDGSLVLTNFSQPGTGSSQPGTDLNLSRGKLELSHGKQKTAKGDN